MGREGGVVRCSIPVAAPAMYSLTCFRKSRVDFGASDESEASSGDGSCT